MFAIQPIKSKAIEKLFGNKILTSVVGWSVIALIFYTEYGTDDEYRFGILYQLAVVFFAWYFDIGYVIFVAFICSILRVFSIALHGDTFSSINVPILNSLVRFATFFLTALIMNGLKKSLLAQKESNNNLMRANEEVSRLAAIKSEFTSMVSHELRTPLMVIKEGIGIVQDGSVGIINPGQQKYLDLAKKNVDRLSRLINDVLDFQKLSSSQAEIPTTRNNINKLLFKFSS